MASPNDSVTVIEVTDSCRNTVDTLLVGTTRLSGNIVLRTSGALTAVGMVGNDVYVPDSVVTGPDTIVFNGRRFISARKVQYFTRRAAVPDTLYLDVTATSTGPDSTLIAGGWYYCHDEYDSAWTYRALKPDSSDAAQANDAQFMFMTDTDVHLTPFVTAALADSVTIPNGEWQMYYNYSIGDSTYLSTIEFKVFRRDTGGTDHFLFTFLSDDRNALTMTASTMAHSHTAEHFDAGEKIVVEPVMHTMHPSPSFLFTLNYEGAGVSRLRVPNGYAVAAPTADDLSWKDSLRYYVLKTQLVTYVQKGELADTLLAYVLKTSLRDTLLTYVQKGLMSDSLRALEGRFAAGGSGVHVAWANITGAPAGGVSTFLQLTDTPNFYAGSALKLARVKADTTGLEFIDASSLTFENVVIQSSIRDTTNCQADIDTVCVQYLGWDKPKQNHFGYEGGTLKGHTQRIGCVIYRFRWNGYYNGATAVLPRYLKISTDSTNEVSIVGLTAMGYTFYASAAGMYLQLQQGAWSVSLSGASTVQTANVGIGLGGGSTTYIPTVTLLKYVAVAAADADGFHHFHSTWLSMLSQTSTLRHDYTVLVWYAQKHGTWSDNPITISQP